MFCVGDKGAATVGDTNTDGLGDPAELRRQHFADVLAQRRRKLISERFQTQAGLLRHRQEHHPRCALTKQTLSKRLKKPDWPLTKLIVECAMRCKASAHDNPATFDEEIATFAGLFLAATGRTEIPGYQGRVIEPAEPGSNPATELARLRRQVDQLQEAATCTEAVVSQLTEQYQQESAQHLQTRHQVQALAQERERHAAELSSVVAQFNEQCAMTEASDKRRYALLERYALVNAHLETVPGIQPMTDASPFAAHRIGLARRIDPNAPPARRALAVYLNTFREQTNQPLDTLATVTRINDKRLTEILRAVTAPTAQEAEAIGKAVLAPQPTVQRLFNTTALPTRPKPLVDDFTSIVARMSTPSRSDQPPVGPVDDVVGRAVGRASVPTRTSGTTYPGVPGIPVQRGPQRPSDSTTCRSSVSSQATPTRPALQSLSDTSNSGRRSRSNPNQWARRPATAGTPSGDNGDITLTGSRDASPTGVATTLPPTRPSPGSPRTGDSPATRRYESTSRRPRYGDSSPLAVATPTTNGDASSTDTAELPDMSVETARPSRSRRTRLRQRKRRRCYLRIAILALAAALSTTGTIMTLTRLHFPLPVENEAVLVTTMFVLATIGITAVWFLVALTRGGCRWARAKWVNHQCRHAADHPPTPAGGPDSLGRRFAAAPPAPPTDTPPPTIPPGWNPWPPQEPTRHPRARGSWRRRPPTLAVDEHAYLYPGTDTAEEINPYTYDYPHRSSRARPSSYHDPSAARPDRLTALGQAERRRFDAADGSGRCRRDGAAGVAVDQGVYRG